MATLRIADSVGRVLGDRYRLTRPLGTGASAHVYVADDVVLRRRVAVKVLHPGLADDEGFLRRFRAEARNVAALRHPNILRVYDWGEDDGSPYLVTELLEGGSLRALLDRGYLLTPSQATDVGFGAAEALEYAHRRGLVHRDIKPANLLFDDEGRVCIADFGLARALAESTVTEPVGAIVGTARYAAPEQVRGQTLDARADVYALALVLVEATTGIVPFAADTMLATLMARLETPLRLPGGAGPLAAVIEAAGTIDPARRLDATGMVAALDALARTLPAPAPLPTAGPLLTGDVERDVNPTQLRGMPSDPHRSRRPVPGTVIIAQAGSGAAPGSTAAATGRASASVPPSRPVAGPTAEVGSTAPPGSGSSWSAAPGSNASRSSGSDETLVDVASRYDDAARDVMVGNSNPFNEGEASDELDRDGGPPFVAGVPGDRARPARSPGAGTVEAGAFPRGSSDRSLRRRSWRRILAIVVVPLLLLLVIGWVLTHRSPPLESVPALRGETEAQARSALARHDLRLTIAGRTYSATAPSGTVTGQVPAGGRLHPHRPVAVTVSLGPRPVEVPDHLSGLTQAAATELIEAVNLQPGAVTRASSLTVPADDVISTSPASGTLLPGRAVSLLISTGKPIITVPLLVGAAVASYAVTASALRAAHLVASERLDYSTTVPAGQVIGLIPPGKSSVRWGSSVRVDVSKGPHLVVVPDLAKDTVAVASQMLGADGFVVTGVTGNPTGRVTGTDPPMGRSVLYGSSVQILTNATG